MDRPPPRPRVLVVDDCPLICGALIKALRVQDRRAVVECLPSADAAPAAASSMRANAVAIELSLPGADPLAAIRTIVDTVPGCGVLVLSGRAEGDAVLRAIDAGAIGYVTKDETPAFIARAILAAARGDATFSKGLLPEPPGEYPGR